MGRCRNEKNLFFSKTLDFLERHLPGQAMKSTNAIGAYRDALTASHVPFLKVPKLTREIIIEV